MFTVVINNYTLDM